MYQLFNRVNSFDNSPFQFAKMSYLRSRIDENYRSLIALRDGSTGRLDSSHLLMTILISLSVKFNGDLIDYMSRVEIQAKSICSSLGITSSFSKGRLFTESVFYPGCPEIILYARNTKWTAMDLWRDWRSVTPIEILNHPITSTKVVELAVKNEMAIEHEDLAVISIDIPLLAAQWKMWQAAYPGHSMEEYLTTVPLAGAIKSHLNVAMFNRVQAMLGIRKTSNVQTNLNFSQTPTDDHADEIVRDVIEKISGKAMTGNQILSTIPVPYGDNYLDAVALPSMTPTFQVTWALIAQKMEPAAMVLEFGNRFGFDRLLKEVTVIKRTLINIKEDKTLSNGLTSPTAAYLEQRMQELVISRLPA